MAKHVSRPPLYFGGRVFYHTSHNYYITGNRHGVRIYLHRAMWQVVHGTIPKGYHVHHKDGNKENNTFDNFALLTRRDHYRKHWEDPEYVKRAHAGVRRMWADPNRREALLAQLAAARQITTAKWADPNRRPALLAQLAAAGQIAVAPARRPALLAQLAAARQVAAAKRKQLGAEGFRKDPTRPSCDFQGFTE